MCSLNGCRCETGFPDEGTESSEPLTPEECRRMVQYCRDLFKLAEDLAETK